MRSCMLLATYTRPLAMVGKMLALLLSACVQVPPRMETSGWLRFVAEYAYSVSGVPGFTSEEAAGLCTNHTMAVPAAVPFDETTGITPPLSGRPFTTADPVEASCTNCGVGEVCSFQLVTPLPPPVIMCTTPSDPT